MNPSLLVAALLWASVFCLQLGAAESNGVALENRVRGMLIGSLIGDALGGPFEFQPKETWSKLAHPPKVWEAGEKLDEQALAGLRARVRLNSYRTLRSLPEPYAHWTANAPPGVITDDSRHKLILLQALKEGAEQGRRTLTGLDLARAYCEWPPAGLVRAHPGYARLASDWLGEYRLAARWILGERDPERALPPERLWNGLPTCVGQMNLLPLAALFPGNPEGAYRAAWDAAWGDNGFGRDMNCALVAALAAALSYSSDAANPMQGWMEMERVTRTTDPWRFAKVPWCERAVDRWLRKAEGLAKAARGRPFDLFAGFDREFAEVGAWEAQVPFVVVFACARLCGGDPLATLALTTEWGQDTDSYAQLAGAFIGALHGEDIFPKAVRATVEEQLLALYGEKVDDWAALLRKGRE